MGATTIDGATYTVDAVGNRSSKTNHLTSLPESYSYDAIYQLTQVVTQMVPTELYSYDKVGNRLSSLTVPSYTYNNSNQLTATPTATYTYDNNGNTLTKTEGPNTTTYAWDFENRLLSVSLPAGGGTVSFKYDPFGRRVQKNSATGTTNYAYDGADIAEEVDATGSVLGRYAMGPGIDQPLAMLRGSGTSYYQADGLGSITSLTDSAGSLAASYTYDAFGKLVTTSGTLVNPFRYTARELDSETGLYYYRARYYDPNAGGFLNEDPAGFYGGLNFYHYNGNDPINFVDPFGLQRLKECRENCEQAGRSQLRVKLSSIVGNPKDATLYYDLTGTGGQSYVVFQAESNPARTELTEYGPGTFGEANNTFTDHIRIGIGRVASDSSQTFYAIPATWRKDKYGNDVFRATGVPQPVLVQDLAGNDFCNLKVWIDGVHGNKINGNPITENLRSFLPPKR